MKFNIRCLRAKAAVYVREADKGKLLATLLLTHTLKWREKIKHHTIWNGIHDSASSENKNLTNLRQ